MKTARHVDSTNPEKVRVMLATGRTEPTVVRTVCTICGHVLKRGPVEPVSHGLCGVPDCESVFLGDIDEGLLERLARRSELTWGRYMGAVHDPDTKLDSWHPVWQRHNDRFLAALRRVARRENGPDRDASQRVGSDRGRPSGDDTSKVADAPAAGNSGRNGRYVVTVGSPGGVVDERFYADFAAMVIGARDLTERYPHPDRQIVCGNVDEADIDSDGLTDAERELLGELL